MAISEALTLGIVIKLTDEATEQLKNVGSNLSGLGKAALALGTTAVAGIGAVAASLWDCAQAAAEEERGITRLSAAVRATGADWDTASAEIEDYIAAQTRRAALDDGEARDALTRLTVTTGDYKKALELLPIAMDMAAGANIDLSTAAQLVGRVAEGNIGVLSRYGITLQEGATAQEALAALQERFAGQAEAYGNTFAGAQAKMGIALGNLKETVGAAVLPILADFINTLANLAIDALPHVEAAIEHVIPIVQRTFQTIQDIVQTVLPVVQAFIETVLNAIQDFWNAHGAEIMRIVNEAFTTVQNIVQTVMPMIQSFIETVLNAIKSFWDAHGAEIMRIVHDVFDAIKIYIETVLGVVSGIITAVLKLIKGDWSGAWDAIKSTLQTAWDGMKRIVSLALDAVKTAITTAWNDIRAYLGGINLRDIGQAIINSLRDGVISAAHGLVDAVRGAIQNAINAARGALGLRSPSKVFMAFGEDIMLSMALGIDRGVGEVQDALREALGSLASPVLPFGGSAISVPVLPAPGRSGGSGNTYILNYTAVRNDVGYSDAVTQMRLLELYARLGGT